MKRRKILRKGFRPRDEARLSIARNQDQPRGREVTLADVSPYALQLHGPCRGKGAVLQPSGGYVACKCATKRFLAAHPELVLDEGGRAFWPVKPPETTDERLARVARAVSNTLGPDDGKTVP